MKASSKTPVNLSFGLVRAQHRDVAQQATAQIDPANAIRYEFFI
jgi:hypothetical protein